MINYKFRDLFNQDSVEKQVKITYDNVTITNEDLFVEEMSIEESLCSESQLKFGCCESSMVKFKVANIFSSMFEKTIDISVVIEGHTEAPFRYGRYKVQSDKPTADREWREIVAYDAMYDIINSDVTDWYNAILPNDDSTVTMRQFRKSFCDRFGLSESDDILANDNMIVEKTISVQTGEEKEENASVITESNGLSGLTVISAICEINGCFGHIGRDGKMHYIYLAPSIIGLFPSNDLYPSDDLYPNDPDNILIPKSRYISCKYEDYTCKKIDKLQIHMEENDIGVIVGDGENSYIIEGNFLVYGKSSSELNGIAEAIFEKIKDVSYIPFNADCVGNPCIEVGDAVRLPTTYQIVESYVLKRTLKGIQALKDSYFSAGTETFEKPVNSVHSSILALKGKTNKLERTVEETKSTITDLEAKTESQIRQTASSILATVASAEAEKTWDESGYYIEYYGYGLPHESYGPSEEYYEKYYLDQGSGKVYICKRVSSMNGYYYYWSPIADLPLVTAQLSSKIEQASDAITAEVTRATGAESSLSGRITVTESDITAEVARAIDAESSLSSRINITESDITAEVTRATGAEENMSSRININTYNIKEEVTRATYEEGVLSSQIQLTESSISLKVSRGDVVSEINQSAEAIELSAGRLVITSGNFTLDSSGNVSMTGNVNATSGEIGPFLISYEGLTYPGGTEIRGNVIYTNGIQQTATSSGLYLGRVDDGCFIYARSDLSLERGKFLQSSLSNLIGWTTGNYIDIGDYRSVENGVFPEAILFFSKKIRMVNSSGDLVDIHDFTSDERKKNILSRIEQEKAVDFIKNLVPISYQYKEEDNPVTHWGFGAQTTLAAMLDSGIGESRLIARNPYVLDAPINQDDDTTFFYSMKTDELAAPYAAALQYILNEIETIKNKLGGCNNGNT